ncbi:hypothetical protein ISCGN_003267 [Ixodes scapularis]
MAILRQTRDFGADPFQAPIRRRFSLRTHKDGRKVQCPGAPPTTEPNKGDTRLREAGVEAVYCLARGAPKGPNIPRAQLNHQGPLFPGHGYATHSQTWVGEPTWLGVRSDATHQAPTKVGAPCVRVWWPTWLGSVVTLLTKHLAPKVQAPPAGLGVRGDATLQTPAFTGAPCGGPNVGSSLTALTSGTKTSHPTRVHGSCATRTEGKGKMDVLRARLRQLRKHNKRLQQRLQGRRHMLTVTEIVESVLSLVSPAVAALVEAQLKMTNASRFGRPWCSQNKAFALGLYFHSPKGYRYCRQLLRSENVPNKKHRAIDGSERPTEEVEGLLRDRRNMVAYTDAAMSPDACTRVCSNVVHGSPRGPQTTTKLIMHCPSEANGERK